MRFGFTTGSCAAAGAKAAAFMLLTGSEKNRIKILTPKGIEFDAEIVDIKRDGNSVSCSVVKDGGDDPDVTTGAHVVSTVEVIEEFYDNRETVIKISGGPGVGRVTKPGLDQPVGEAAINHVPREMIIREVSQVCGLCDFHGKIKVTVSVPEGVELAGKTFNPRLGITDGISILGTSGVVEPMSSRAILETINVELNQHKALGKKIAAVTPGNYGQEFMQNAFGYDLEQSVKCSNFIGDTIDMAVDLGFEKLLLTGHIGKLIKVAGGMMNTHSREGDCRMELLAASAIRKGASSDIAAEILQCVTTEEGIKILEEKNLLTETMKDVIERIMFYLNKRSENKIEIGCMVYSNQYGLLCKSENAEMILSQCLKELNSK